MTDPLITAKGLRHGRGLTGFSIFSLFDAGNTTAPAMAAGFTGKPPFLHRFQVNPLSLYALRGYRAEFDFFQVCYIYALFTCYNTKTIMYEENQYYTGLVGVCYHGRKRSAAKNHLYQIHASKRA
jgi:hypothetical protein